MSTMSLRNITINAVLTGAFGAGAIVSAIVGNLRWAIGLALVAAAIASIFWRDQLRAEK